MKAIRKAIEGGWRNKEKWKIYDRFEIDSPEENSDQYIFRSWNGEEIYQVRFTIFDALFDPLFWKGLGNNQAWGFGMEGESNDEDIWQEYAMQFYGINLTQGFDKAIGWLNNIIKE